MKSRWNLPGTGAQILAAAATQWYPQKVTFEYLKDFIYKHWKTQQLKNNPWTRDWNADISLSDIAYVAVWILIFF